MTAQYYLSLIDANVADANARNDASAQESIAVLNAATTAWNNWAASVGTPLARYEAAMAAASNTYFASATSASMGFMDAQNTDAKQWEHSVSGGWTTYENTVAGDGLTYVSTVAPAQATKYNTVANDALTFESVVTPAALTLATTQVNDGLQRVNTVAAADTTEANAEVNDALTSLVAQISITKTAANSFDDATASDMTSQIPAAISALQQQVTALTTFFSSISTSDAIPMVNGLIPGSATRSETYIIPSGSVIFVTNNTAIADSEILWFAKPKGVPTYKNISNWDQLAAKIQDLPDGSLPAIFLSGHGSNGGVQTKGGRMTAQNMPANVANLISRKLASDGELVLLACEQGAEECREAMEALAEKIEHNVVGNTGNVVGTKGKGTWKSFSAP